MKAVITEEWIKEKAIEIYNLSYYKSFHPKQIAECIRSLLKEYKLKGEGYFFYLDLADDECWLIKSKMGYRERIGWGDGAKSIAIKRTKELNTRRLPIFEKSGQK